MTDSGQLEQLTLGTGKVTRFGMAGQAQAAGYTRPAGQNIIGTTLTSSGNTMIGRYSLTGRLLKQLTVTVNGASVMSSADGRTLITDTSKGLELISNLGGVIRSLPIPGTQANTCRPDRWWNSTTVMAGCAGGNPSLPATRLWLVPVNGAKPTALTPQRGSNSRDLGDMDAWQISGGLYLQAAGPCGTVQLFRQARNGSITLISPAGTTGNDLIRTVYGSRMLLDAQTGCPGSTSLLWYDPRTKAEQWLLRTPSTQIGVISAIPYYARENAQ
jgi:TolB protein